MSHERFKFDDEIDDLEELQPIKTENKAVNDIDKSLADSGDKDSGDKSMGKGKKKKRKFKKSYIFLLLLLSIAIGFVIYVFVAGGNDGPVYGLSLIHI